MLEEHDHSTIIKNSEQQKFQIEILSEHFKPNDPEVWFHSYGFYEKYYAELLKNYEIRIEGSENASERNRVKSLQAAE